ncbi:nitrate/nitrite two-component system sensor histidine kinase NarX [Shewanella sp.]|uniref:nitrate/nitrite two-component system sensor histidine kinase NarX n=1 Tax=Shewanella sp. TaxID=50422 RepID=UPI003A985AF0
MLHFLTSLSIVKKLAILLVLLSVLAISGMMASFWLSQSIQGNAHAIDAIGSMRMKSYQQLSMLPLTAEQKATLTNLPQQITNLSGQEHTMAAAHLRFLNEVLVRDRLTLQFEQLNHYWDTKVKPQLLTASNPDDARAAVNHYVELLNVLIISIDKKTEQRLHLALVVQSVFILLCIALTVIAAEFLRRRILQPWRQIFSIAASISKGDFSLRFHASRHRDEMDTLGEAINSMSAKLSHMYDELELRVVAKTQHIRMQNQSLTFLYNASTLLHSEKQQCLKYIPILKELEKITPLTSFQLKIFEYSDSRQYTQLRSHSEHRPMHCADKTCDLCIQPPVADGMQIVTWNLADQEATYGELSASCHDVEIITNEHKQLLDTLVEQISIALSLEQKAYKAKQLMLMEERAAIARELHDSIAQSLSCLKMKISCLQMKKSNLNEQQVSLISEMRHEVGSAYSQLRELLTTFRLKLDAPGLRPALESAVAEFSHKLGFAVELEYHVPPQSISSHQTVHITQIVREALNNIYKHSQASHAVVCLNYDSSQNITLTVQDNGIGLTQAASPLNHYGLTIMQDRASLLPGSCHISNRANGGVEVKVCFATA